MIFSHQHIINSEQELIALAQEFLKSIPEKSIVCLSGEMGVGKTTFIQQILKCLGVENLKGSPTYSIINEYISPKFGKVFHLDLYRIKNEAELLDIGIEEIFYQKNYAFIEWPDLAQPLLPEDAVFVSIQLENGGSRKFEWSNGRND